VRRNEKKKEKMSVKESGNVIENANANVNVTVNVTVVAIEIKIEIRREGYPMQGIEETSWQEKSRRGSVHHFVSLTRKAIVAKGFETEISPLKDEDRRSDTLTRLVLTSPV